VKIVHRVEKLERLEAQAHPPSAMGKPRDQVVSAALARLASNDLILLIGALELEGPDSGKGWSAEQVSAGERLPSAMATECLQAGFKSLAEFDRLYPDTTTATSFRNGGPASWKHQNRRK
jgi:hypothetical protein